MTDIEVCVITVEEAEALRAEIERLRAALQEMPDIIKDFDGGLMLLRSLLQKLHWKSIDKDNMEYSCRIPYNVMDELRRALENKP